MQVIYREADDRWEKASYAGQMAMNPEYGFVADKKWWRAFSKNWHGHTGITQEFFSKARLASSAHIVIPIMESREYVSYPLKADGREYVARKRRAGEEIIEDDDDDNRSKRSRSASLSPSETSEEGSFHSCESSLMDEDAIGSGSETSIDSEDMHDIDEVSSLCK